VTLRRATIWIVVATLVAWVGWDIYAAVFGGLDATESDVIRDASQVFEAIPFAGGVVAGHWWVSREKPLIEGPARFVVLVALAATSAVVAYFTRLPTALHLALGIASGHFLWPMGTNPERDDD
jgi:hypothetical protein